MQAQRTEVKDRTNWVIKSVEMPLSHATLSAQLPQLQKQQQNQCEALKLRKAKSWLYFVNTENFVQLSFACLIKLSSFAKNVEITAHTHTHTHMQTAQKVTAYKSQEQSKDANVHQRASHANARKCPQQQQQQRRRKQWQLLVACGKQCRVAISVSFISVASCALSRVYAALYRSLSPVRMRISMSPQSVNACVQQLLATFSL